MPLFFMITGSRSEWFILSPLAKALKQRYALKVIITGSHLSIRVGETYKYVEEDIGSDNVVKVFTFIDSDELIGRAKTMAIETLNFVDVFYQYNPNAVIILGDREETLAAASAANYLNIPVIHLGGGDRVVGNVDDTVRHAVTKLSHLHFPFTKKSYLRILQMGEEKWRVVLSGSPALDEIAKIPHMSKSEILEKLNADIPMDKKIATVIYHPISSEYKEAYKQFEILLDALRNIDNLFFFIIKPNMDPGSHGIEQLAHYYSERYINTFKFLPTLPRDLFINLLRNSELLIGNSSLGIHEAPFLKLPVINVGDRQKGRDHSENIIFIPSEKNKIISAVLKILNDDDLRYRMKSAPSIYGDGMAIPRIIRKLNEFDWESNKERMRLLNKWFVDIKFSEEEI